MDRRKIISRTFDKFTKSDKIHEAVLFAEDSTGSCSYSKGYNGLDLDSPIFLASNSKQMTTAVILQLMERGQLTLDDKVSDYFPDVILEKLHVHRGTDWSFNLTLWHLLSHTSGLPDYFMQDHALLNRILVEDFEFPFLEVVAATKFLKPHFIPGEKGKSFYSNANFDILNQIIEKVTDQPLDAVLDEMIFDPLGMADSYLAVSETDLVPPFYFGDQLLHRPKVIKSLGGSAAVVSTARDLMTFLKAFFHGRLFSLDTFEVLQVYRKLQFFMRPVQYGGGHMMIPLHSLPPFFRSRGILLGHSGIAGSFAFYDPRKDLFYTGNFNQIADPSTHIRLMIKLARQLDWT